MTCPQCGEAMKWTPPYPAQPEVNIEAWNGGWDCPGCEFQEEYVDDEQ